VNPLRAICDGIEEHLGNHLLDQAIDTAHRRGLISPVELEVLAVARARKTAS
jgi:hypothetical protein